jgi:short-subunit dehydrogenase
VQAEFPYRIGLFPAADFTADTPRRAEKGGGYNRWMVRAIANKVILITGASSGIGRETALALAPERPRLVLVARRADRLEQLRHEAESLGAAALCLTLDLAKAESIEVMIRRTCNAFERIDVLINNAAFGFYGPVEHTPRAVVEEIFAVNFEAALYAIQQVIPIMRAQGSGHIINISSVAGKRGLPLSGIYSATKFALDGLTQALRLELKHCGIDVTLVNPAATETEFFHHARSGDVSGPLKPMGRVLPASAVAKDIVNAIRQPKVEVYPYRISRVMAWANALAPSLLDKLMMPYLRDRLRNRTPV